MKIEITKKQEKFMSATADEVLFGGAAGGGKSYVQLIDALTFASTYAGSKQLILRRSFAELEKSIIRVSRELFPLEIASYNESKHVWTFRNGSLIDFGYCQTQGDVYQYQSAEYDVIRFDELTHFNEDMYVYLISRIRGANDFPKSIKSTTNPGNVGHVWVKKRFIEIGEWGKEHACENGTRLFIPSKVQDNIFLMEKDPKYLQRLENLPEKEKKALLYGDWDIFEGQFFAEFNRGVHVCEPFVIPSDWRRYRVFDYGLDCFACYFVAVDNFSRAYFYKEIFESNLIVSEARDRMLSLTAEGEEIYRTLAPPDMWSRHKESGKSTYDIFREGGVVLTRANNDRVQGFLQCKEWLNVFADEQGFDTSKIKIFRNCTNLISHLAEIQTSDKNPNDCASTPHEITHSVDAFRYFCISNPKSLKQKESEKGYNFRSERKKPNPLGRGNKIEII